MADNMNVTVRDPLAPRRQMPPIVIGRAGEYGATTVTFDLRGFIDRYGAGVPTLLHKRPPDDEAYIVPLSAADTETHDRTEMPDSETLVWHVGQVATSYVGNGKIELQWHPEGAAKKSAQFDVVVLGTIGNPVSEIPDAQQIYLDVMQGIADDAEDAADRAEAATEHYPKIENGYWYVWDAANSEWANTGVSARGPAGAKGDTGDSAYEEAVKLGFVGTEEEWIASLKGETGANGRDGQDGTDGVPGRDGVSPTVQIEPISGGHRVTITDAEHPSGQTFDVMDGEDGSGEVDSVNGKTGAVVLDASDVGALPADTPIPAAVTEQTVAGWGFTKNTGTYSKPSGGIPKTDLASDVQASLGKADTALQQHQSLAGYATESYVQTQIANIPDELPTVAAADNGKFLRVVSGAWAAEPVSTWQGGSY